MNSIYLSIGLGTTLVTNFHVPDKALDRGTAQCPNLCFQREL